jgi:hypothetical protein
MFARLWFGTVLAGLALLAVPSAASAAPPVCDAGPYLYDLPAGLTHVHPQAPCTDADGDPISVQVTDAPDYGTLEPPGTIANDEVRYYTANADAAGKRDTMTFVAVANGETSNAMTVDVVIKPANHVPVCADVAVSVQRGASVAIPAPACSDADGDAYQIIHDRPAHGRFDAGSGRYTASGDFTGTDTMTFVAIDDWDTVSAKGVVRITVTPGPKSSGSPQPSASSDRRAPRLRLEAPSSLAIMRAGIPFTARTNEAGRLLVRVYVSRGTARRYGLARDPGGRVLVGSLRRTVTAGDTTARVKLFRRARVQLDDAARVKLSLIARISDAAGNARTARLKITLRRD